jgi:phage terminase small subunit
MPTPRKSIEQLKLSGSYQQNKKRYDNRLTTVPTIQLPVGRPPTHLEAAEKAVWAELVRVAHPGLLARSDRLILEVATKLVVRMRTTDTKTSEVNALMNVLAKLGMTPAARLKMNLQPLDIPIEPTATINGWDELDELD